MKKTMILGFALLWVAQMMWAGSVTPAANIPSYWASADNKSGAALWSAISAQTNVGYSSLGYSGLWTAYATTDVYPGTNKIWDMYGECDFTYSTDKCGTYSGVCDCYNREHSIPQSWWGGGTTGIGCDIFHLVPTDGKINGVRSNDEFGIVNGGTDWRGNKSGTAGSWSTDRPTIASAAGEVINGSGNVFEPKDEYKGDFARGYMGTIIKWQLANLTTGNNFFSGSYTPAGNFGFTKKAVVLMMKWHREDPVSQKEIDRNNGIQQTQGNRNPFIDYPYLAEYIWGEHAGETVDMDLLMPSTDPDFVPGVSDGARTYVPPIPAAMYGVTWSVNGTASLVDSIAENTAILTLPATPVSCSAESNVFRGWTDAAISGTLDVAPAVLYTKITDFPAVTEDVTYYAVFAKAETVEYGPELGDVPFEFSTPTSYESNGVSIVFEKANGNTAPKYYDPAMRAYGGNTITVTADGITQILFEFSSGEGSNAITPNVGTFKIDTWTGNADQVIFTIGGTSGHRRIHAMTVTRNSIGGGEIYSRYITSCQSTVEAELVPFDNAPARKLLINNQLYIQVGDRIYDSLGRIIE